jgi:aminoglycoside 6'-N-acetyltransferase
MIKGNNVLLRKIYDEDWVMFEKWAKCRGALWGPYQRFQIDHLPLLKVAYQKNGLLSRESGVLLIETIEEQQVVGFVRYSMLSIPDADHPYPEIGFGIPDEGARGKGYGREGVDLLVGYIFSGYPTERIAAFTDVENIPAQRLLKSLGFQREGVFRKALFRDGKWHDIAIYSILRRVHS